LPAAKAALVALMQTTNNAAAAISINNLMRNPPVFDFAVFSFERTGSRFA